MHLNSFDVILADAAATPAATAATSAAGTGGAQPQQGSIVGLLFPMAIIFIIMYFLMIRPQSQQRKQQQKLQDSLKSGDKIVTASGIVGVVVTVKDTTVSIRSADAKMEITKSSIVSVVPEEAAQS